MMQPKRRKIHHIKQSRKLTRYQCYFLTLSLLLMLAGDINPNPGTPTTVKRTPKYPCTVCDRGVRSNSKAVSCDNCELWTHINCCHMDGCDYNALQNSLPDFSFLCNNCLQGQLPFSDTIEVQHHDQRSICSENKSSPAEKKMYDCFKKKGLHIIHFNARSLLPKLAEVRTLVVELNAAIVCVTETWLDDSVMDSEIELSGYVVQRKDRERSGGGVCMYIRSDLAFNPRPELSTDQLETLWIEIILPKTKPVFSMCVLQTPSPK